MTTGLLRGPFVTTGQPVSLIDPSTGVRSVSVQIQNASPFPLLVTSGTDLFSMSAWSASTFDVTYGNGMILCTPVITGVLNGAGSITATWLLRGQVPPQQDGPLTDNAPSFIFNNTYTMSGGAVTYIFTNLTVTLVPGQPIIQVIVTLLAETGGPITSGTYAWLQVAGVTSGHIYYAGPTGFIYAAVTVPQSVTIPIVGYTDTAVQASICVGSVNAWTATGQLQVLS